MTDDLDGSAAKALKLLLETAPTSVKKRIGGLENRNNKWTKHSFLQRKELYTKKYGLTTRNSETLS